MKKKKKDIWKILNDKMVCWMKKFAGKQRKLQMTKITRIILYYFSTKLLSFSSSFFYQNIIENEQK